MAAREPLTPYWPALMRRPLAAKYCDMTPSEFEGEVAAQRLPLPVDRIGKGERWSRAALDAAIDRLAGGGATDWRAGCKLYAEG